MRPVELSLRGYGSYREPQTIDLDQIRLACITGPNGAGKSTIFDALSWALLGLTRTGDLDEIITDGENKAEVSAVFEHDGGRFRVTRTRSRGKNTTATLEKETEEGSWEPFGEKGPRAVGAEIERMLGISAETYSSTVLLAQGDSGRFATADASTRKRILSEILDLGRYGKLAKGARERSAKARTFHDEQQRRIDEIDVQTADAEELAGNLSTTEGRLAELGPDADKARSALAEAERAMARTEEADRRLASVRSQITSAEQAAAQRVAKARQDLSAAQARLSRAQQSKAEAERRLQKARDAERAVGPVEQVLADLRAKATEAAEREERVIEEGRSAREVLDRSEEEIGRLSQLVAEAEERRRTLDHDGAECFTCHQSLSPGLRQELVSGVEEQLENLRSLVAGAASRKADAEKRRGELKGELNSVRQGRPSEEQIAEAERRLASTRAAADGVPDCEGALADAAAAVGAAVEDVATCERSALQDPGEDEVLKGLRTEAEELERSLAGAGAARQARAQAQATLEAIASEREQLTSRIGRLRERLESYGRLATERQERADQASEAARDAQEWGMLARAYGPDGVPNLVFSGVVAELERDASGLMEDLTNGKFRLVLRTATQKKTDGGTKETLDVVVATPTGERRYQALSGGERFRVDLALRVALSRLLTRRSGSPIEFLALDEGWGALDPEGINAMLDSLRQLHSEFDLILTVTHTPEVAAAFEARLEVEQDSDGTSVVSLVAA